jgi:hypothetical protein
LRARESARLKEWKILFGFCLWSSAQLSSDEDCRQERFQLLEDKPGRVLLKSPESQDGRILLFLPDAD